MGGLSRALVLALLAALALAGWQWCAATAARAETAEVRLQFASYREAQERQARQALETLRVDKSRADKIRQEALDAEYLARLAAEADARGADAAAGQLRRHATDLAATLRAGAGADPAVAAGSEAAATTADLLAQLLDRVDGAAGEIGRYADQARRAGQLCERHYGALIPPDDTPEGPSP
ncbi:DUF2514 domain-containing protein [Paucibacter sp. DJ1R-11]|uniref:DUF2514 domain-containing protein n=1 Tax=Paucibacter sp. DJ1R-11 TaxID=2893556 RepID=UPI0021E40803|nr:DUF2514 domain-containing protein [Paucibacter sp. DJ1R-11]MCV2365522.1 DUF2514 domain-containing protein [Paucibacter sp. DJ1R-11]